MLERRLNADRAPSDLERSASGDWNVSAATPSRKADNQPGAGDGTGRAIAPLDPELITEMLGDNHERFGRAAGDQAIEGGQRLPAVVGIGVEFRPEYGDAIAQGQVIEPGDQVGPVGLAQATDVGPFAEVAAGRVEGS